MKNEERIARQYLSEWPSGEVRELGYWIPVTLMPFDPVIVAYLRVAELVKCGAITEVDPEQPPAVGVVEEPEQHYVRTTKKIRAPKLRQKSPKNSPWPWPVPYHLHLIRTSPLLQHRAWTLQLGGELDDLEDLYRLVRSGSPSRIEHLRHWLRTGGNLWAPMWLERWRSPRFVPLLCAFLLVEPASRSIDRYGRPSWTFRPVPPEIAKQRVLAELSQRTINTALEALLNET